MSEQPAINNALRDAMKAMLNANKVENIYGGNFPNLKPSLYKTIIPEPRSPKDQVEFPETTYGVPPDWDYKTATKGMDGEDLPTAGFLGQIFGIPKAVGWTPSGRAYYGTKSTFTEWMMGLQYRLYKDSDIDATLGQVAENVKEDFSLSGDTEQEKEFDFGEAFESGDYGAIMGSVVSGLAENLKVIGNLGLEEGESFQDVKLTEEPIRKGIGILGILAKVGGEVLMGLGAALQDTVEVPARMAIGALEGLDEAGEGSPLPDFDVDKIFEGQTGKLSLVAKYVLNAIDTIGFSPYNALRAITAPGVGKGEIISDNVKAWRIMGTAWVDHAAKAEYIRRLNAGENGFLLAEELMDPVAEIATSIIFDPLNVYGIMNKGRKVELTLSKVKARYLNAGAETAAHFDDVGKMTGALTDAKFMDELTEAFKLQKARVGTEVDKFALENKLFGLSAVGKRSVSEREFSDMVKLLISHPTIANDPDKVTEVIHAFRLMADDNPGLVRQGIAILGEKQLPVNMFMSEVGTRFGLLVKESLTDSKGVLDWAGFIDEIDKAPDGVTILNNMTKRIDKANKRLFPTIAEKLDIGLEISRKEKVLMNIEKVAGAKAVGWVNNFYAQIYMGANPGFAMRNSITNSVHILSDQGVEAFVSGGKWLSNADVHDELNFLTKGLFPTAVTRPGGAIAGGARGVKIAKKRKNAFINFLTNNLERSSEFERRSGARIMLNGIKKTFRQMSPHVYDVKPMIKTGLISKSEGAMLVRLIEDNGYDVLAGVNEFMGMANDGFKDLFRSGQFLNNDTVKIMDQYEIWGPFKKAMRGHVDGEDAETIRLLEKAFDDQLAKADDMAIGHSPYPRPDGSDELANHADGVEAYYQYGSGDPKLIAKYEHNELQNDHTDKLFKQATRDFVSYARGVLGDEVVNGILDEQAIWRGVFEGSFWKPFNEKHRELIDTSKYWSEQLRFKKITPQDAWKGMGLNRFGEMPKAMDYKGMQNFIWEGRFKPTARKFWSGVRDNHAIASTTLMNRMQDALKAANPNLVIPPEQLQKFGNAMEQLEKAVKWDTGWTDEVGGIIHNFVLTDEAHKANMGLETIAMLNDMSSSKLFNIIKKHSGKDFERLPNVPFDEGMAAYRKWAAQNNTKIFGVEYLDNLGLSEVKAVEALDPNVDILTALKQSQGKLTSEMDARVAESVKIWASDNIGVSALEAGSKGTDVTVATKSPFPDWWNTRNYDFNKASIGKKVSGGEFKRGKESVDRALQMLADGTDDNSPIFDRLRAVALEQAETSGEFSDEIAKISAVGDAPPGAGTVLDELDEAIAGGEKVTDEFQIERLPKPYNEHAPDNFEPWYHAKPRLEELKAKVMAAAKRNIGKKEHFLENKDLEKQLLAWADDVLPKEFEMRVAANEVGNLDRDFGLVDYGAKTNFDPGLGLIYPYQLWYSRTYPNWMKRMVNNPAILAGYHDYTQGLDRLHAGMPDWWKKNINTNELLGREDENPFFFNLEATLNPLNGMTGIDYNDPRRRVDGWSATLDGMNKFGPSLHPVASVLMAYSLKLRGEDEAASRWGGRLFPQSALISTIDALIGDDPVGEVDPWIHLFADGMGPHEQQRTVRALAVMQAEGMLTPEQAIEVARLKSGPYWELANERAVTARAPGQIASFFFGVGFKGRSINDMQIDTMYGDFFRLMNMSDTYTSDEFRLKMDELRGEHPFMDTMMIGSKAGPENDMGYTYNVLGRIPPGSKLLDQAGLDSQLVDKFYESKGDFASWDVNDYKAFMAAIADLGAILKIPEEATATEWANARAQNDRLWTMIDQRFGERIRDKIDGYYSIPYDDFDSREQYLTVFPEVGEALDFRAGTIVNSPPGTYLSTYYNGIDRLQSYYDGVAKDEAREMFGEGIFDVQSGFFLQLSSQAQKLYKAQHPELERYWDWIGEERDKIDRIVADLGSKLRIKQDIAIQQDISASSIGQQQLLQNIQSAQMAQKSVQEWQAELGPIVMQHVVDNTLGGKEIPRQVEGFLDNIARNYEGVDRRRLIQLIGISIRLQSPQTPIGAGLTSSGLPVPPPQPLP